MDFTCFGVARPRGSKELASGGADKVFYVLYPLFGHELLYSLQNIKRSPRVGEAGGASLNGTGNISVRQVLEMSFKEIRRRTNVVGRLPNEISALMLVFGTVEEKAEIIRFALVN